MAEIEHTKNPKSRMVLAISKKRCGFYAHPFQDEYKIRPKGFIYNNNGGNNPKSQKHNPRR